MITGRTSVYALLGHPIARSPSPALHNRWFSEHGIDSVYVACSTQGVPPAQVVPGFRALGLAGANVTVPLKEAVLHSVDRLEARARAAGAVNTLYWQDGQLVGDNTDGIGFVRALREDGFDPAGARVAMIGAGGAARGIASALIDGGVREIVVLNRTEAKARLLAHDLSGRGADLRIGPLDDAGLHNADLAVVSLPRTATATLPLDPGRIAPGGVWCDIAYGTPIPVLSERARATGRTTADGWGMLCWQAAFAFERWTGVRADAEAARSQQP